jgi:hypothetical protein
VAQEAEGEAPMSWWQIALLVSSILFVAGYGTLCLINERMLSLKFWRPGWRAAWKLFFLEWKIESIKRRKKRTRHEIWIENQIKEKQAELVELAFKDPNNFLG